jgi:GAF domain-containing protein
LSVIYVQAADPLLWIIDTAPLFLGVFAALAGRRQDILQALNAELVGRDRELKDAQVTLEERMQERSQSLDRRTNQLKAVADVGRFIASFRDLPELLQQSTRLIHQHFGYYHAGIFLLDEHREFAVLAAANSEGGQRMLARKHRLKIEETSLVGYAIRNAQARIALDAGRDAVFFNNPDLPQTRSEVALPLTASGQILGALDIQSVEPQAFTEEDVAALQILAEQIAVAIQNANLFRETEKALETARLVSGEISRNAWNRILRSEPRIGFIATPPGTVQTQSEVPEAGVSQAFETGEVAVSGDGLTVSVPIRVRGQSIGAMRLKKSEIAEAWTQDEINLAVTLSEQLSGALESARLYRESQQRAARESMVAEISAKIGSLISVENIVQTAVQELGNSLPDTDIAIQFTTDAAGQ